FQQAAENHAVTTQQDVGDLFQRLGVVAPLLFRALGGRTLAYQAPPAGILETKQGHAPAARRELSFLVLRNQQRTQAAVAVGIDQSRGDQLTQRRLGLGAQQVRATDHVVEERGAVR